MKDTDLPLDILFFNEDCEAISVKQGRPNTEDFISEDGVKYVVELNLGSDVEPGDILDLDEEEDSPELDLDPNTMYIIGSDGEPQAVIQGGERIFSRASSRVIIRKAMKAFESKADADYKSLGRYVFNEIKAQDSRKPQYVKAKEG